MLPNFALAVTETARKATGPSAAQCALSRTKIVKRTWAFREGYVFESCLLRFLEISVPRMTASQSPLFAYTSESEMNSAIQAVLAPVLSLQQGLGTPAEYTVCSGRIGGLTAGKYLVPLLSLLMCGGAGSKGEPLGPPTSGRISFSRITVPILFLPRLVFITCCL